jgi:hypothetical protein
VEELGAPALGAAWPALDTIPAAVDVTPDAELGDEWVSDDGALVRCDTPDVADGTTDLTVETTPPTVDDFDGVETFGTDTDGVDTDGVETVGVDTDGVDTGGVLTDGVVTVGVLTGATDTDGVVTDGTVTDGTLTDGVFTEGSVAAPLESDWTPSTISSSTASRPPHANGRPPMGSLRRVRRVTRARPW